MLYSKVGLISTYARTSAASVPPPPSVAGPPSVFVFRPGGPQSNGVYPTWLSLMIAVAQVNGPKIIQYDNSFAPCAIPGGTWNIDNCTITSAAPNGGTSILEIGSGVQLLFGSLALVNATLRNIASTTPIQNIDFLLRMDTAAIEAIGAALIRLTTGGSEIIASNFSNIGGNAVAAVEVEAPGSIDIFLSTGSAIGSHGTVGSGGGSITYDDTVVIGSPQALGLSTFLSSSATSEEYIPAVLANWSGTSPGTVKAALDRIAAKIGPIA